MLRMDDPEAEEVGVDQVFDARMKRAIAVLQALLDYYRVKKVPPIATVQRIEIEDAALAMVTGEFCLTDVAQNSPVTMASAASSISIRCTVAMGGTFLTR